MEVQTFSARFKLPVNAGQSAADFVEVERVLPDLVKLLLERRSLRSKEHREALVDLLLSDVQMKRIDVTRAGLQARALERIFTGIEWLSADEIGTLGKHGTANPGAAAHRWKSAGQLFAIRREGRDMYPRYALGNDFKPLPLIRKLLSELKDWDALQIAGWFESTSSHLGGKRPRDLVTRNPEQVLEAAKDAMTQLHA